MKLIERARSGLVWFGRLTYRVPGESPLSEGATLYLNYLIAAPIVVLLAAAYVPSAYYHLHQWNTFRISVPIDPTAWRVHVGASPDCADDARADAACLGSPASSRLWTAKLRRDDPYRVLRDPGYKARQYRDSHFWLGTIVTVDELKRAGERHANQLILGWLNSAYRIWADGMLVADGDGARDLNPIILNLPPSRLAKAQPLLLAIRLEVREGVPILDAFNEDRAGRDLGVDGHGFTTAQGRITYTNLIDFWGKSRPIALCFGYVLCALLIFFFWWPLKNKPEYFYMVLFALASAAFQCQRYVPFNFMLDPVVSSDVELLALWWMPSMGLLVGLAFARVRKSLVTWGAPVLLGIPVVVMTSLPHGPLHELFKLFSVVFYVPLTGVAAGTVCLLHAYHLKEQSKSAVAVPVRVRRLVLFGMVQFMSTALYVWTLHGIFEGPQRIYWIGFEHLAFFVFFCGIALSEYGRQEYLVKNTPLSEYHQRPILPDLVNGALLTVDLKDSERLFRGGASVGEGAKHVESCLAALWNATLKARGAVLQTEGDALRAFFDQSRVESPLEAALVAVNEMAVNLAQLEERFRADGVIAPGDAGLRFRAGLAFGDIKPIWHEVGKSRLAAWTDAGTSSPMVESVRHLELERKLPFGDARGVLVLADSLLGAPGEVDARFARRGLELAGKHGHIYRCAVYLCNPDPVVRRKLSIA